MSRNKRKRCNWLQWWLKVQKTIISITISALFPFLPITRLIRLSWIKNFLLLNKLMIYQEYKRRISWLRGRLMRVLVHLKPNKRNKHRWSKSKTTLSKKNWLLLEKKILLWREKSNKSKVIISIFRTTCSFPIEKLVSLKSIFRTVEDYLNASD